MPTVSYVGVSRRISDEAERNRLRAILEEIKPDNVGVIVRTAAEGKSREEFKKDIDFLVRMWERIKQREAMFSGPRLIHADEQLMFRVIRDMLTPDIDHIAINDNDTFEKLGLIADVISPQLKYSSTWAQLTLDTPIARIFPSFFSARSASIVSEMGVKYGGADCQWVMKISM
ncbi:Ribonuclease G [bioreactor metagenome]|uniref:Ribonuclease G n=1 Tax=bioreactor metagenome TaxID=1076179 RepID=A0A645I6L4_9ZZZZ